MEPDLLYQQTTQQAALRDWVEDQLAGTAAPDVHDQVLPGGATAPFVLLETATGSGRGGPPMAGDQWSDVRVLIRVVAQTADQASRILDSIGWAIAGRDEWGQYVVPMPQLGGLPVLTRAMGDDRVADVVGGVPQVSETARIDLQRGEVAE